MRCNAALSTASALQEHDDREEAGRHVARATTPTQLHSSSPTQQIGNSADTETRTISYTSIEELHEGAYSRPTFAGGLRLCHV